MFKNVQDIMTFAIADCGGLANTLEDVTGLASSIQQQFRRVSRGTPQNQAGQIPPILPSNMVRQEAAGNWHRMEQKHSQSVENSEGPQKNV